MRRPYGHRRRSGHAVRGNRRAWWRGGIVGGAIRVAAEFGSVGDRDVSQDVADAGDADGEGPKRQHGGITAYELTIAKK